MYKNYIFDLYGTLADIQTNEQKPYLWKKMAEIYRGSIYPGNKEMVQFHLAHLKKSEANLKEAKEKQQKAVEKYDAIYLTIQEKAAKKGLTPRIYLPRVP